MADELPKYSAVIDTLKVVLQRKRDLLGGAEREIKSLSESIAEVQRSVVDYQAEIGEIESAIGRLTDG